MVKKTALILLFQLSFLALIIHSCNTKNVNNEIQKGDLLFCSYDKTGLAGAIDKVTQTTAKTHFSHVGIISIENRDTFVIHASTKNGVNKALLKDFIEEQEASKIVVYRLKSQYVNKIDSILTEANTYIGLPYNFSYLPGDSSFYCSQLIQKLFSNQKVFSMEPMTFKNPETGKFDPAWVEHYKQLSMPIPEGLPGCNPNGLAASDKLKIVKNLW